MDELTVGIATLIILGALGWVIAYLVPLIIGTLMYYGAGLGANTKQSRVAMGWKVYLWFGFVMCLLNIAHMIGEKMIEALSCAAC